MKDLKELEKRYEELGKEIERLKKDNNKWKPKIKENYWYYDRDVEVVFIELWTDEKNDNTRLENGVIFKTKEEAKKYAEYQKAKKEYSYKFSKEEWEDYNVNKYYIYYSYEDNKLAITFSWECRILGHTYFKTEEQAKEFIDKYKDDILKYEFGVEE